MWLYGKGEKNGFWWELSAQKGKFAPKIADFFGFLNFKAPKVPLLRKMRAWSEKQKSRFFIELQLCFTDYARIWRSKVTFSVLKLININLYVLLHAIAHATFVDSEFILCVCVEDFCASNTYIDSAQMTMCHWCIIACSHTLLQRSRDSTIFACIYWSPIKSKRIIDL